MEETFNQVWGKVCNSDDQCFIPPYLAYCNKVGFPQAPEGQCRPSPWLCFVISIPILLSFFGALLCCWCRCSGPCKNCWLRHQVRKIAKREIKQEEEIDREVRVARQVAAALGQSLNRAPRRPRRARRQGERDMVSLPMIDWQGSSI